MEEKITRTQLGPFQIVYGQDLGPRDEQQDSVLVKGGKEDDLSYLFVVCDGHGALGACSQWGALFFAERVDAELRAYPDEAVETILQRAVEWTDREVCQQLLEDVDAILASWQDDKEVQQIIGLLGDDFFRSELGSGSTMTALAYIRGDFYVVHVGDSRVYQVRESDGGGVLLLTEDHVWEEDEHSVIIGGTIYRHDLAMARAFGHPSLKEEGFLTAFPDILKLEDVKEGDRFLLCSDGLPPIFSDETSNHLMSYMEGKSSAEFAIDILEASVERSTDNISLITFVVPSSEELASS